MTMRGIKNITSETKTATLRGKFSDKSELRAELYSLIGK
jgi:GTP cyclohydrolase I